MSELRSFICPHCGKPAASEVHGGVYWDGFDEQDRQCDPPIEWALVQCNRCRQPVVQAREDFGLGFQDDEPSIWFPSPHRMVPNVPSELCREWLEARNCLGAQAYSACLVMVRRTLEGVCKDQGVELATLDKSLSELKKQGVIDGVVADWADSLRLAGNRGAHFDDTPVSRDDAEDALAFADALLNHVYVLRKRFEEFQKRLQR